MDVSARDIALEVVCAPPKRLPYFAETLCLNRGQKVPRSGSRKVNMQDVEQIEQVAIKTNDLRAVVTLVNGMLIFRGGAMRVSERRQRGWCES